MVNGALIGNRGGGSGGGICDGGHPPAAIDGSSMTATGNATVTSGETSVVGCCSASTTQHNQQLMTHGGGGCESIASGSITAACSASAGSCVGGDAELVGVGGVDDQVSRNSTNKTKTGTATSFFTVSVLLYIESVYLHVYTSPTTPSPPSLVSVNVRSFAAVSRLPTTAPASVYK